MIRPATTKDVPRLIEMGKRFLAESSYKDSIQENPEQMGKLINFLMGDNGGILVCEQGGELIGMLGYSIFPHPISAELIASEVFWWVEPEHRGRGVEILRAAEKAVRERGANKMQMVAPNARVGKLYSRLGYAEMETMYQRRLS